MDKNVKECTIEDLFKSNLLHYAVNTGNKEMFEGIHNGTYAVINYSYKDRLTGTDNTAVNKHHYDTVEDELLDYAYDLFHFSDSYEESLALLADRPRRDFNFTELRFIKHNVKRLWSDYLSEHFREEY